MPRIVSVWLPRWPILRFLASEAKTNSSEARVDAEAPFVLTVDGPGGPRIAALNLAAERLGIIAGESLADARSRTGISQARPADPASDRAALIRLALWATRYAPAVALFDDDYGGDGLFIDVTGAAHLFGGEENLLADLSTRLSRIGLPPRVAIADTAGSAWALSRFHRSPMVLASGREAEALSPLSVAALRLSADTSRTLRRLGFKKIGSLIGKSRSPFAVRFENELLLRLDQALGRRPEALCFVTTPPVYRRTKSLMEPVFSAGAVAAITKRLAKELVSELENNGVGVRAFRLTLYRVDNETVSIDVGLTLPTRSPEHLARLLALKLERIGALPDVGFGFETLSLAVITAERMTPRQSDLAAVRSGVSDERHAALIDRLRQRLGPSSVWWLAPFESHLPERAERPSKDSHPWSASEKVRPALLLKRAEQAEVIAAVPEGPPKRFRWRGGLHRIVHAEGPERIAREWWRSLGPTRDYYLVEDDEGRRFWLYREGLYERETTSPRWFVHGFFA